MVLRDNEVIALASIDVVGCFRCDALVTMRASIAFQPIVLSGGSKKFEMRSRIECGGAA